VVVVGWTFGLLNGPGPERLITSTTTVITFVPVFIVQSTQNREGQAMQTTLDAHPKGVQADVHSTDPSGTDARPGPPAGSAVVRTTGIGRPWVSGRPSIG
jgi:Low affinity iron permease